MNERQGGLNSIEFKFPFMVMLVGLPGSGKSTAAKVFSERKDCVVLSSDAIREELYGNVNDTEHNAKVFEVLHRRSRDLLRAGISVCIDSTNLSKKRRIHFLNSLKNINCDKVAAVCATSYEECLRRNLNRDRVVPEKVIRKMYTSFAPPHESEGFDKVWYILDYSNVEEIDSLSNYLNQVVEPLRRYDQHNEYHALTLGNHLDYTAQYVSNNPSCKSALCLILAAWLHDIGKPFTKTRRNTKGEYDGNWHYYNHHCVSAYDAMVLLTPYIGFYPLTDTINLIYYHMHPYREWTQSSKKKQKDLELLGSDFVERVYALHEADKAAH